MTDDAETAIFEILSGGKYGGKGFWTESPQAGNKNPLQELLIEIRDLLKQK